MGFKVRGYTREVPQEYGQAKKWTREIIRHLAMLHSALNDSSTTST